MVTDPHYLPIGQILRRRGLLTDRQIEQILAAQSQNGRPFGELAERMFGLGRDQIEQAWQSQYLSLEPPVNLNHEPIDPAVVGLIDRRRAWQFQLMALRREAGRLVVATTPQRLRRSVVFAWHHFAEPVRVIVCEDPNQMTRCLKKHHSWSPPRFAGRAACLG